MRARKILNVKRSVLWFCIGALNAGHSVAGSGARKDSCGQEEFERLATAAAAVVHQGDYRKAFDLSLKCANSGLAEAQFSLGVLLDADRRNELIDLSDQARDRASLCWLQKAALQGHEEAAAVLADSWAAGWRGLEKQAMNANCWRTAAGNPKLAARCAPPTSGACELEVESVEAD